MIINSQNISEYVSDFTTSELSIDPRNLSDSQLEHFFNQLLDIKSANFPAVALHFSHELQESQYGMLSASEFVPPRLELSISKNALSSPGFSQLINKLNEKAPHHLKLNFLGGVTVDDLLTIPELANTTFPIITNQQHDDIKLADLLANNQALRGHDPVNFSVSRSEVRQIAEIANYDHSKFTIKRPQKNALGKALRIEVQHIEEVAEEIAQEETEAQIQHADVIQSETQAYLEKKINVDYSNLIDDDELIDFEKFKGEPYNQWIDNYQLIEQEFFANLPNAIKFFTKKSALYIAKNSRRLSALNIHNRGDYLTLKSTKKGEVVLDYDLAAVTSNDNPFTPKTSTTYYYEKSLFPGSKVPDIYKNSLKFSSPITTEMDNLWARFGANKTKKFIEGIISCEEKQPEFSEFLYKHYLSHFPQWDSLAESDDFLQALDKISDFPQEKLNCLKRFLVNTGSSRHNLRDTLDAFELMWSGIETKCLLQKVDPYLITKCNWYTPIGGNPVVYMERFATIIHNSKNLQNQLEFLDDVCLDNFGAYYAVNFEHFHFICHDLGLKYNREQIAGDFAANKEFYTVNLDFLLSLISEEIYSPSTYSNSRKKHFLIASDAETINVEDFDKLSQANLVVPYNEHNESEFIPPKSLYRWSEGSKQYRLCLKKKQVDTQHFATLVYRYLCQQVENISHKTFIEFERKNVKHAIFWYGKNQKQSHIMFTTLLLLNNINQNPDELKAELYLFGNNYQLFCDDFIDGNTFCRVLYELYNKNVRFDLKEGIVIAENLSALKRVEFYQADRPLYVQKLSQFFHENKYAALQLLRTLSRQKPGNIKQFNPALFLAIDTANFFIMDERIAKVYADDILLFGGLLDLGDPSKFNFQGSYNPIYVPNNLLEIKQYLVKSTLNPNDSNYFFAVRKLIEQGKGFNSTSLLDVFKQLDNLPSLDTQKVIEILDKSIFLGARDSYNYVIPSSSLWNDEQREKHTKLLEEIHYLLQMTSIASTVVNQLGHNPLLQNIAQASAAKVAVAPATILRKLQLNLSLSELENDINLYLDKGIECQLIGNQQYASLLVELLDVQVRATLYGCLNQDHEYTQAIAGKILQIKEFTAIKNFAEVQSRKGEITKIAELIKAIQKHDVNQGDTEWFNKLLNSINYTALQIDDFSSFLVLLENMRHRDYKNIALTFVEKTGNLSNRRIISSWIQQIRVLINYQLPTRIIEKIINIIDVQNASVYEFVNQVAKRYLINKEDSLLNWMLNNPGKLSYKVLNIINSLTHSIEINRDKITRIFQEIISNHPENTQQCLNELNGKNKRFIFEILTHFQTSKAKRNKSSINYLTLFQKLNALEAHEVHKLHQFINKTHINIDSLYQGLERYSPLKNLDELIKHLERQPFGKREEKKEFDCSQVNRVVNNLFDLNRNTPYLANYRAILLNHFNFVNDAGHKLAIYRNKPANKLSNKELQELFLALKTKSEEFAHLNDFERSIFALPLIREAMYRATLHFPYSTQMIAIIDCLMHDGDVMQNIDTGQGKSLIDAMKAATLWLTSDHVDVTTSSIADAQRDLKIYGDFFNLLGIPYGPKPITSRSEISEFKKGGINYSTFSQLRLFFIAALIAGIKLLSKKSIISLVPNESDAAILDDRMTYRYAKKLSENISKRDGWIYTAVIDYLDEIGEKDIDLRLFRNHLRKEASKRHRTRVLTQLSDDILSKLFHCALLDLEEEKDYIITTRQQSINGELKEIKEAKILDVETRIEPFAVFGRVQQQLLHARLNKKYKTDAFPINEETITLIASNNRHMIDFYRAHKGYIWGSSGTVGNEKEIKKQYERYGFHFSKIPPHQEKKAIHHPWQIVADKRSHFQTLAALLVKNHGRPNTPPAIIFFKDIKTAKEFKEYLKDKLPAEYQQLYSPLDDEKQIVKNAAKPGMVTVSTPALGRNTDIKYDKEIGLIVYQTYIDNSRRFAQRSGRTGREGSKGEIYTLLNREDFHNLSTDEYINQLELLELNQHDYNEELHSLVSYLLLKFADKPAEFFIKKWSVFNDKIEDLYALEKSSSNYQLNDFIDKAVMLLYQITEEKLDAQELLKVLQYRHPMKSTATVNNAQVAIENCLPSEIFAQQFVNYKNDLTCAAQNTLTRKLKFLLAADNQSYSDKAADYFSFLNKIKPKNFANLQRYVIHKFFNELLEPNARTLTSKKCYTPKASIPTQITSHLANNKHFLETIYHMSHLQNKEVKSVLTPKQLELLSKKMLNEYLENNWFINSSRKKFVTSLITKIGNTNSINQVVDIIYQEKENLRLQDIKEQTSFWRKIKPLHFSGQSRLHDCLDDMLLLFNALNTTNQVPSNQFNADNREPITPMDAYNKAVFAQSQKKLNQIENWQKPSHVDRHGLFKVNHVNDNQIEPSSSTPAQKPH